MRSSTGRPDRRRATYLARNPFYVVTHAAVPAEDLIASVPKGMAADGTESAERAGPDADCKVPLTDAMAASAHPESPATRRTRPNAGIR